MLCWFPIVWFSSEPPPPNSFEVVDDVVVATWEGEKYYSETLKGWHWRDSNGERIVDFCIFSIDAGDLYAAWSSHVWKKKIEEIEKDIEGNQNG